MDVKALGLEVQVGRVDAIHIRSNEGDIYTASAVIHGREHTLEQDGSHQPVVFHSYIEAKRRLGHYAIPVTLEPSAVYDEMGAGDAPQH